MHPMLLEPDVRQLPRGVDLWAAHVWQLTGGASLDNLTETPCHFLLDHRLEQQVRRQQRHQGKPGQRV